MTPLLEIDREHDALPPESPEHSIKRNPGAAIETTEITSLDGAKVAWKDVKHACEVEGLTITEVCARFRLKYPAVYARATRGRWNVITSVKKRAKELQKREAELKTSAAEWVRRGDVHRDLVFGIAHGALAKANLKPPRTFKEAKIADEMARKACGLDQGESPQKALLIHINELDAAEPVPIEARVIDAELPPCALLPFCKKPYRLTIHKSGLRCCPVPLLPYRKDFEQQAPMRRARNTTLQIWTVEEGFGIGSEFRQTCCAACAANNFRVSSGVYDWCIHILPF